ncbi:MAG: peptidoglycan DD-metalloendopeptidase family protein [Lachnospiraceae bacterium]|nr:peptidoglycan DD-metalloendopeptidase family protein [Lachnospiraceae bacterium]
MNRRTWKEFITNRSTIWTLSLCLVGAIVLGGMAAVNKSRNNDNASGETELGQIAYLEEEVDDGDAEGSIISSDEEDRLDDEENDLSGEDNPSGSTDSTSEEVSGSALSENTSANSSAAADSTDMSGDSATADNTGAAGDSTMADSSGMTDASTTADSSDEAGASATTGSSGAADNSTAADAGTVSSENSADESNDTVSDAGAESASDADGSANENADADSNSDDNTSADSEEASSASIISEQALIEAGVSFTAEDALLWPSAGTVIIDYSMDKSVYFSTLNQYKYNPALIISSDTGNQVLASAKGIVESISIDEETGTTLVLNIGNGYKLTYGQLMEPAVSEGDVVEAGDLLAYISEPTKYYSTEGSNLYFAMTKDGEPVDPVLYLE